MSLRADLQLAPRVLGPKPLISPAVAVLAFCLILGTLVVGWRARVSANAERLRAQTHAIGSATALELQFTRAVRAAEILGALARQSGGPIPEFQRTATELHAAFPDLASLELQPGGIVSDIVPRPGNERRIGFNVFKDPAYRNGATAALQSRTPTVSTPLVLDGGEPGLVVRVPIFQRRRNGQSQFWGFVAVSMRLSEGLRRTGLSELSKQGYDYALFVGGPAPGGITTIARQGIETLRNTVQQPIHVQNVELRLALRRQGGWVKKSEVLFESLTVLFTSFLLFSLVSATTSRRQLDAASGEAQRQLAVETAERKQAQGLLAEAKAASQRELGDLRTALQQSQVEVASLTQALSVATEAQQKSESSLKQMHLSASELQGSLDRKVQSHEEALAANQAELAEVRTSFETTQQRIRELEGALAKTSKAENEATSAIEVERTKSQAAIADLQAQLEAKDISAAKEAQAGAVRLEELEAVNRELRVALAEAQRAKASEAELEAQLPAETATATLDEKPVMAFVPPADPVSAEIERGVSTDESVEGASQPVLTNPQMASTPVIPIEAPPAARGEEPLSAPQKRKRTRAKDRTQIELFGDKAPTSQLADEMSGESTETNLVVASSTSIAEPATEASTTLAEKEESTAEARSTASPPADAGQLRRAINQILPLLTDLDPGATDCFEANRMVFCTAFSSAGFEEFETLIKGGDFEPALEHLRKAAKKHGLHI